ncbi:MAG TPA: 2OG-Fe(II) oxygenase [Pyrinomonadaceae bacterium]|nr:2OG-Fe(II) oxygenase [Pyrinomonadaceae bacterium]
MFVLDAESLGLLAAKLSSAYSAAEPFPHTVIDDFLPAPALASVADSFPRAEDIEWHRSANPRQQKLAVEDETLISDDARWLLYQLNSATFMKFLEVLTGIDGLIPDPYFAGGGLHQIEPGGYLKIHADFNRHPKFNLERRLNLLLYLNRDWKEEYGGHLELWNREMTRSIHRILPSFNRCVIFNTTDFSYHGHPEPLMCPAGMTRKSLALYYYSHDRPAEEVSDEHGTLVQPRPGEIIDGLNGHAKPRAILKRFIPPVVSDIRRYFKKK